MKVGFIGLGQMGAGMALNLLKAGHDVAVFNRTAAKAQALTGQGARLAHDPADAAAGNDAVITMLANDAAVEEVVFGPYGIDQRLSAGAVHISMSTISIALAERLSEAHAGADQRFIAAPVFGRPDAAAAARLAIVIAGASDTIEQVRPLLSAMGQTLITVSQRPRDAALIKISGNFMIASVLETLGEAVALMRKADIDPQTFIQVLTSTLFNAPVYKTYGALIAEQKFSPAGFAAPLGYKDVGLALAAAKSLQVPMPLASLLSDRFLRLLAEGGDELDWSAIAQLSAADAGLRGRT